MYNIFILIGLNVMLLGEFPSKDSCEAFRKKHEKTLIDIINTMPDKTAGPSPDVVSRCTVRRADAGPDPRNKYR